MKKNFIIMLLILNIIGMNFGNLFAQPLEAEQDKGKSGINNASFGIFNSDYDNYLNSLFWNNISTENFSIYAGIDETTLNIGFTKKFSNNLYSSFLFQEKITNYKWWPENMTNESWTIFLGWKDFSIKAGYYDFCFSGGKGTAMPYLFLANKWNIFSKELDIALGFDVAMQFGSGNKMDVFQPKTHLLVHFGNNDQESFILKYRIMGTYKSAHNITDVKNTPLSHEVFFSYSKFWELLAQVTLGFKPSFNGRFNAINPTIKLNNFLPSRGEYDLYFSIPLALEFFPENQHIFSFITALKIDLYYASFNHLGFSGIGGNNYSGWVPGIGLGLGARFSFSNKCFLDFGFNYTAQPELTEDLNEHEYDLKQISIQSLLESPLTVSLEVKF